MITVLQTVADTVSSSRAENRFEDAIEQLSEGSDELNETPPVARRARSRLENAAQILENAIRRGYIDPDVGLGRSKSWPRPRRTWRWPPSAEDNLADGDYDGALDQSRSALIDPENA